MQFQTLLTTLAVVLLLCSCSNIAPVIPTAQREEVRAVVFLQGFSSSLHTTRDPAGEESPNPACPGGTFGCVRRTLAAHGLDERNFLKFSYTGGRIDGRDWRPNGYACEQVTGQSLEASVATLDEMLRLYAAAQAPRRVAYTLIGHSYGGLVAFRAVERALAANAPFTLRDVITLDSPLNGGSLAVVSTWIKEHVAAGPSGTGTPAPDIKSAIVRCTGAPENCLAGPAADEVAALARNSLATAARNLALVERAKAAGIGIHALGSLDDLVYLVDPQTQVIPNASTVRLFRLGNGLREVLVCAAQTLDPLGHSRIHYLDDSLAVLVTLLA